MFSGNGVRILLRKNECLKAIKVEDFNFKPTKFSISNPENFINMFPGKFINEDYANILFANNDLEFFTFWNKGDSKYFEI